MSEIALGECCDSCGEAGHMLADPTMHYVEDLTLCGDCYRESERWFCPYCGGELYDERSAHCGEVGHAVDENEINRIFGD